MPLSPIHIDLPCIHCHYNLRTLDPSATCPECGKPIAHSLGGDSLPGASKAWLWSLAAATFLIPSGTLIALIGWIMTLYDSFLTLPIVHPFSLGVTPMAFGSRILRQPSSIDLALIITGTGLRLVALFVLTTRPDGTRDSSPSLRRILAGLIVIALFLCFTPIHHIPRSPDSRSSMALTLIATTLVDLAAIWLGTRLVLAIIYSTDWQTSQAFLGASRLLAVVAGLVLATAMILHDFTPRRDDTVFRLILDVISTLLFWIATMFALLAAIAGHWTLLFLSVSLTRLARHRPN